MPEEIIADEEELATVDETYNNGPYNSFLNDLLSGIPLLSLWDVCYLIAKKMVNEGSVPDSINTIGLKQSGGAIKSNSDDLPANLRIIQKWLSEQLMKSIDKKEINPKILSRFINGEINPRLTYLDDNEINAWFTCRSINISWHSKTFFSGVDKFIKCYRDGILNLLNLLVSKAYDSDFKMPRISPLTLFFKKGEREQLERGLRSRLATKGPHGNRKRYASQREEILGAALSVIYNWPEDCKNTSGGKFEGTKIAELIDKKSLFFWPETGSPPLSRENMERNINKWIHKPLKSDNC